MVRLGHPSPHRGEGGEPHSRRAGWGSASFLMYPTRLLASLGATLPLAGEGLANAAPPGWREAPGTPLDKSLFPFAEKAEWSAGRRQDACEAPLGTLRSVPGGVRGLQAPRPLIAGVKPRSADGGRRLPALHRRGPETFRPPPPEGPGASPPAFRSAPPLASATGWRRLRASRVREHSRSRNKIKILAASADHAARAQALRISHAGFGRFAGLSAQGRSPRRERCPCRSRFS